MAERIITSGDFSPSDDFVDAQVTDPDDQKIAILQDGGVVEADAGNDTILGEVDVLIDNFSLQGTYVGVRIVNGDLFMEEGNDALIGDVQAEIDGESNITLVGIEETNPTTIYLGDGDDEVVGTAHAVVSNGNGTSAFGIRNAGIIAGAGLDSVVGFATIVAGEDSITGSVDNTATGIADSYVNTGVGRDEVEGEGAIEGGNDDVSGSATGIEDSLITTYGGGDTVTGTARIDVGDNTDSNWVSAAGIYGGTIQTGEGEDEVTGHADIRTGNGYSIRESFGIYLYGGPPIFEADVVEEGNGFYSPASLSTGPDADRVVGRVDVETGDGSRVQGVSGISSGPIGFGLLDTGDGNDDVTGLVEIVGGEGTVATGILGMAQATVQAGGDDDTIVGGVVAKLGPGSELEVSAGIGQGEDTVIAGSGNDITAGVLLAPGAGAHPLVDADGIQTIVDTSSPADILAAAADILSDVVAVDDPADAAASAVDTGEFFLGTGADGLSIGTVAGIAFETVFGGPGSDLTAGIVGTSVGDDAAVSNADGIFSSSIFTGGGNGPYAGDSAADGVAGVSVNLGGEGAVLEGNDGIDEGEIFVDAGFGAVAGISINSVGADGTASNNSGISDSDIFADSPGQKVIFGVSATEGALDSVHENNHGILRSDIETGRDDDIVVGASIVSSDSGAVDTAWGSGIACGVEVGGPVIETNAGEDFVAGIGAQVEGDDPNEVSYGIVNYTVCLGADDDVLVARGATAGLENTMAFGDGGDDVFDIQNGTGAIYGGEDGEDDGGDTLILAGERDDYIIIRLDPSDQPNDDDDDFLVLDAATTGSETDLTVYDMENIVFESGETIDVETSEDFDPPGPPRLIESYFESCEAYLESVIG